MFCLLISIPSCANNNRTTSQCSLSTAKINAVLLNNQVKSHKKLDLNSTNISNLNIINASNRNILVIDINFVAF